MASTFNVVKLTVDMGKQFTVVEMLFISKNESL